MSVFIYVLRSINIQHAKDTFDVCPSKVAIKLLVVYHLLASGFQTRKRCATYIIPNFDGSLRSGQHLISTALASFLMK